MDDLTDTQRQFLHLTHRYKRLNRRADRVLRQGHESAAKRLYDDARDVHDKLRAQFYEGDLIDECSAVCDNGSPQWELLAGEGEQLEMEAI